MREFVREPEIEFATLMIVRLDWLFWLRASAWLFTRAQPTAVTTVNIVPAR